MREQIAFCHNTSFHPQNENTGDKPKKISSNEERENRKYSKA
jgi:hypothetical protein